MEGSYGVLMNECVLWQKAKNKAGYGITWFQNKWAYAHRVVAQAQPGQVVRHRCDNPSCVNPQHLEVGSHQDNSQDMVNKQRQAVGEACGNSKLTLEQVTEIRSLKDKFSSRQVAAKFNISKTNVLDIWNNKIWRNL